ncbi:EAL domain-containing protein [uncultured Sulfitobacter sp.]|uniref:EAL domain-containing protein n=1 Tax=uncultured Sulfitobacter sp. TaxID=191468 RepID=UPI0026398BC4|nr:EAL domain-containing protein [uncultured Sulfitobacter sp.]
MGIPRRKLADMAPGADSPLNFAITQQDQSTLALVQEAIRYKQTLLAFQPVMRADGAREPGFHEGLIRVLDPTGRVIPAAQFMDKIETTETGREIDVLALRHGLLTLKANPALRLSINMSARSIGYHPWTSTLNRFLRESPTIGERLILEITESSAMSVPELVIDFMKRLQSRGICFAMDDFGSGQLAIRHFREFLFDIVKIDGQFVRGIAANPDNQVLMRALLAVARHFDMLTVAENVETAQDAQMLTDMGVDLLQGYYFAAPTTRPPWLQDAKIRQG